MRCDAADEWRRELDNFSSDEKKIGSRVTCQMATFEKDCSSIFSLQLFPGTMHRSPAFDFRSEQSLRFIEIWRNQAGERK